MRLFVGLRVSAPARRYIKEALGDIRGGDDDWRWTKEKTWHVTMAFLGEVAPDHLQDVCAVTGPAVFGGESTVDVWVERFEVFKNRMIWGHVADDPDGAIVQRGERLQEELEQAGLPVDRKAIKPHVTLARWGGSGRTAPAGARPDFPPPAELDITWTVREVVLWESHLGGDEPRYERLASFPLG